MPTMTRTRRLVRSLRRGWLFCETEEAFKKSLLWRWLPRIDALRFFLHVPILFSDRDRKSCEKLQFVADQKLPESALDGSSLRNRPAVCGQKPTFWTTWQL